MQGHARFPDLPQFATSLGRVMGSLVFTKPPPTHGRNITRITAFDTDTGRYRFQRFSKTPSIEALNQGESVSKRPTLITDPATGLVDISEQTKAIRATVQRARPVTAGTRDRIFQIRSQDFENLGPVIFSNARNVTNIQLLFHRTPPSTNPKTRACRNTRLGALEGPGIGRV
ncbi:hypothetical protein T5B8_16489 [Salinisphaera sp. T5B8]